MKTVSVYRSTSDLLTLVKEKLNAKSKSEALRILIRKYVDDTKFKEKVEECIKYNTDVPRNESTSALLVSEEDRALLVNVAEKFSVKLGKVLHCLAKVGVQYDAYV